MMTATATMPRLDADAAVRRIRQQSEMRPVFGLVLGSGLGGVADRIKIEAQFDYADLPHFGRVAAVGHRGRLLLGNLRGVPVAALDGRYHFYEGWSLDAVTLPIRVLAGLGAERLILSNAAGGVRPTLRVGDVVSIVDSMSWIGGLGAGADFDGPTPKSDGSDELWDVGESERLRRAAVATGLSMSAGTYLAVPGPTYETRSEYRMMRAMGVDVVGMSTVPEAVAGRRAGMRVVGLSMVTNVADPDAPSVTTHEEVVEVGRRTGRFIADAVSNYVAQDGGSVSP